MSKKDITTTVQINTLDGLKDLIDNDENVKIKIKEAVINGFCKNYLKGCANSEIMQLMEKNLLKELRNTDYFGMLTKSGPWGNDYVLSKNLKEKIKDNIEFETNEYIREKLKSEVQERIQYIEDDIERYVLQQFNNKVNETIEKSVEKIINRKIGEAFRHMFNK